MAEISKLPQPIGFFWASWKDAQGHKVQLPYFAQFEIKGEKWVVSPWIHEDEIATSVDGRHGFVGTHWRTGFCAGGSRVGEDNLPAGASPEEIIEAVKGLAQAQVDLHWERTLPRINGLPTLNP